MLQPAGQQPSPFLHLVSVPPFTHSAVHAAPEPCNVRSWHPTGGHAVGQLPSQVSPQALSVTPLPQLQRQSLSLAVVQPDAQQASLFVQVAITASSTQSALQVPALPCRRRV